MSDYELLNQVVELKDRTPVSQAAEIIMILDGMWLADFNGDMSHKKVLIDLLNADDVDGAAAKKSLLNQGNFERKHAYLGLLHVIYSYCVQAIREYMANNEVPTNLAWAYVVEAERELSSLDCFRFVQSKIKERAAKAGKAAHANSPKQKIKKEVEQNFIESSYPFHKHGYTAKFVRDMQVKYPEIENIKTIEKWVAELKRKKQQ